MSKGASQIATMALYVGVTVTAISGALTVGTPALENMQDANEIQEAQTFMGAVESSSQEVLSEGEGSTRTIPASFSRGELYFDEETESLTYEIMTNAEVISPQSSLREGDVVLRSSADVQVYGANIDGEGTIEEVEQDPDCFMMENEHIRACIENVGSETDPDEIDTSELLEHYELKNDNGENIDFEGNLTVELNEEETTSFGTGHTEPTETGEFIGTGEVKATVSSDYGFTYDVYYRLPTGADFIKVDVQNFR